MLRAKAYTGTQFVHGLCQDNVTIYQSMPSAGVCHHSAERTKDSDARSIAQSREI